MNNKVHLDGLVLARAGRDGEGDFGQAVRRALRRRERKVIRFSRSASFLRAVALSTTALIGAAALPAMAQVVWQGTTDSDWNTVTNWSGGAAPTSVDAVQIDKNVAPYSTSVNDPIFGLTPVPAANSTISSLLVDGPALNPGALTIQGDSTLTVNGNVDVGNFVATTSGSLTIADQTATGNTLSVGGNFTLGGGTVDIGIGGTLDLTGLASTLDVKSGTITLNDATSTVNAGILAVSGGAVGGAGTVNVGITAAQSGGTISVATLNAGTFQMTGGTVAATTSINASSAFDMQAGTVNGVLAGAVNLNKTTAGTVTLAGANTYSGTTNVGAGVLDVTGSLASTAIGIGDSVAATDGTLAVVGNALAAGTAITFNTAGSALDLTGPNTVQSINGANGGIQLTGATTILTLDNGTSAIGGVIGGTGGLAVGAGTNATSVTLTGSNTYSGGTTVANAGTLNANVSNALGATTGTTTVNAGGTLNVGADALLAPALIQQTRLTNAGTVSVQNSSSFDVVDSGIGADTVLLDNSGTLDLQANTSMLVSDLTTGNGINGILQNTGTINVASGATLTVDRLVSGTGGIVNLNGGTLHGIGASLVNNAGSVINVDVASTLKDATDIQNAGAINFVDTGGLGGTTHFGAPTVSNTGSINIANGVTVSDSLLAEQIANFNMAGAGATLTGGGATAVLELSTAGSSFNLAGGTIGTSGAAAGSAQTIEVRAGKFNITGGAVAGDAKLVAQNGGFTFSNTGTVTVDGVLANAAGALATFTQSGTGTTNLNAANTFTGAMSVNAGTVNINGSVTTNAVNVNGGTLNANSAGAFINTVVVTQSSGAFNVNADQTIQALNSTGGTTTIAGGTTLAIQGGTSTIGGVVAGAGNLSFNGGTAALNGVNTFTGILNVSGGADVTVNSSGSVDTGTVIVNADTGNSALTLTGGSLTNPAVQVSLTSTAPNSATLNVNGGETVGGINADAGSSIVIGTGATLTVNDTAAGTSTVAGVISGAGGLTTAATNAGTLNLDGINTFTGPLNVNGGTVNINGSVATDTINVGGGTLNTVAAGSLAGANDVVTVMAGALNVNGNETVQALDMQGGTTTIATGATLTATNTTLSGGTFTPNGTLSTGTFAMTGGTVTGLTLPTWLNVPLAPPVDFDGAAVNADYSVIAQTGTVNALGAGGIDVTAGNGTNTYIQNLGQAGGTGNVVNAAGHAIAVDGTTGPDGDVFINIGAGTTVQTTNAGSDAINVNLAGTARSVYITGGGAGTQLLANTGNVSSDGIDIALGSGTATVDLNAAITGAPALNINSTDFGSVNLVGAGALTDALGNVVNVVIDDTGAGPYGSGGATIAWNGDITASGSNSAIAATVQNTGNAGAAGSLDITVVAGTTATSGTGGYGVNATLDTGVAGGTATVNIAGNTSSGLGNRLQIQNLGTASVSMSGNVTVNDAAGIGMSVVSNEAGAGNVLTVDQTAGAISGGDKGIFAQLKNTASTGDITITSAGTIDTAGTGIHVDHAGLSGTVTGTVNGTIGGTTAPGIGVLLGASLSNSGVNLAFGGTGTIDATTTGASLTHAAPAEL